MRIAQPLAAQVFLTGATGFVGKVVLEELLRRRGELGIDCIYVLIRTKKGKTATERFGDEIAGSRCFELLPSDWTSHVRPIAGELTQRDCGLAAQDLDLVAQNITHIVNCAASVEFDLPIAQAAASNITSALNMLEVAKRCTKLVRMTSVSTAYVTAWRAQPCTETLAPLPKSAQAIYQSILDGTADEKALLAETGHPNTYTFTKCVAESLLMERRGTVELAIVRPSVVSATWRHPFPGWIDSAAAFAGFALMIGAGYMRALVGERSSRLDVVPCDVVSDRVISATFDEQPLQHPHIRYAVAGLQHSCRVDTLSEIIARYFRSHPVDRTPGLYYIGKASDPQFKAVAMRHHDVPMKLAATFATLSGNKALQKQASRLADKLQSLNDQFPYFTTLTFDFRASEPLDDPLFRREEYAEASCRGIYRYLLKKDDSEMLLAGKKHKDAALTDWQWALNQPQGNWAIRLSALTVRKAMRQITHSVTFDRPSFERAVDAAAPGSLLVLVPNHRSYMDFLVVSYLFFARPDLGIAIPHIAAAEEFSRIPILGQLFKKTQAFYLKRGQGRPDPELTRHIHELVKNRETIQFFIEGARSRSRQFLPPKTGLLRCLQQTGETFTLLPIAISYDRVPEEQALARELSGAPKSKMKLSALLNWAAKMARGEVSLGRVHITCGDTIVMRPDTDVHEISHHVVAELQARTASTTHHLRAFLHHGDVAGMDLAWLRDAIERRGGQVIDSPLGGEDSLDPVTEHSLRYQWQHLFMDEALALWPQHMALTHHVATNSYHRQDYTATGAELHDPRLHKLLRALFEPVARDYGRVAHALGSPEFAPRYATASTAVHELPDAYLPTIQAAFDDLVARSILAVGPGGKHTWGARSAAIAAYREGCKLPDLTTPKPKLRPIAKAVATAANFVAG
ncbi:MAG: NAD-dependent epimerase/dehydratase family protein [Myxococcales bacterium]|nr:NAD-dependent epimerase/dehydratase family protein [Myxococcales bacterium]